MLSICNTVGSTLARRSCATLYTQAGPEIGVASTKAFTTQVALVYALALALARRTGTLGAESLRRRADALHRVPAQLERFIAEHDESIAALAKRYVDARAVLFLGRGLLVPLAREGALKLKEITYIPAEGHPTGELKHGTIALIDAAVPSIFLLPSGERELEKTLVSMAEVAARGGPVIAVGPAGREDLRARCDAYIPAPVDDDADEAVREELEVLKDRITDLGSRPDPTPVVETIHAEIIPPEPEPEPAAAPEPGPEPTADDGPSTTPEDPPPHSGFANTGFANTGFASSDSFVDAEPAWTSAPGERRTLGRQLMIAAVVLLFSLATGAAILFVS